MIKLTTAVLMVAILSVAIAACALTGSTPPPAPHAGTGQYQDCASCHERGTNGAPVTDHPRKNDCVSCHAVRRDGATTATTGSG